MSTYKHLPCTDIPSQTIALIYTRCCLLRRELQHSTWAVLEKHSTALSCSWGTATLPSMVPAMWGPVPRRTPSPAVGWAPRADADFSHCLALLLLHFFLVTSHTGADLHLFTSCCDLLHFLSVNVFQMASWSHVFGSFLLLDLAALLLRGWLRSVRALLQSALRDPAQGCSFYSLWLDVIIAKASWPSSSWLTYYWFCWEAFWFSVMTCFFLLRNVASLLCWCCCWTFLCFFIGLSVPEVDIHYGFWVIMQN